MFIEASHKSTHLKSTQLDRIRTKSYQNKQGVGLGFIEPNF